MQWFHANKWLMIHLNPKLWKADHTLLKTQLTAMNFHVLLLQHKWGPIKLNVSLGLAGCNEIWLRPSLKSHKKVWFLHRMQEGYEVCFVHGKNRHFWKIHGYGYALCILYIHLDMLHFLIGNLMVCYPHRTFAVCSLFDRGGRSQEKASGRENSRTSQLTLLKHPKNRGSIGLPSTFGFV